MNKRIILIGLFFLMTTIIFGQQSEPKNFLGKWIQEDKANSIEIIKEQNKYFVIEFVSIKHELYFSADFLSAVFLEFGKGPGMDIIMLRLNGKKIERYFFREEGYDWIRSAYTYFKY